MLLVPGRTRVLDPLADLLEHPHRVEVAVALQAVAFGGAVAGLAIML